MTGPEFINDSEDLYRRIPPDWYVEKEDRVSSAAFNRDFNLSVDWSKYSTPEETVRRGTGKTQNCRCAAIQAGVPRKFNQEVIHTPSKHNFSHSSIIGEKPLSIARKLARACRFIL